jgi:Flp pilus assembly protein CpaB
MSTVSDKAMRVKTRRWRDPRMWVGVLLVIASVLLGARFLARAGDTVPVSTVAHDIPAGSPLLADDLRTTRVHFDDDATASRYYASSAPLPSGAHAAQDLAAGQLLARSAVSTDTAQSVELPLAVGAAGFPVGLVKGDRVDVWAIRDRKTRTGGSSERIAADVVVLASTDDPATSGDRRVLVGLTATDDDTVGRMLNALHDADVVLIRRGR